jgi:signal transduction histidine kinase
VSDILEYKQTYERGHALADLVRSYEIGPELLGECGDLDGLLARVLEDCDRRLRDLPEAVYESELASGAAPERDRELHRLRSLVAFAREATGLRTSGETPVSMVCGVEDLERLKHHGSNEAARTEGLATERALDLCSDVSRLCHKINNPLTSLMGRAQMLQMQPNPSREKVLKATEVIEESARRVAALIQELAQVVCQSKEDLLTK